MNEISIPDDSIKLTKVILTGQDNDYVFINLINDVSYCIIDLKSPVKHFRFKIGQQVDKILLFDSVSVVTAYNKLSKCRYKSKDIIRPPNKDTLKRVLKILKDNTILPKLEHLINL